MSIPEREDHRTIQALILCQLPPPVHGVTVVNKLVMEELARHASRVRLEHLPIGSAATIRDIGRYRFTKLLQLGKTVATLLARRLYPGTSIVYLPFASVTGLPSIRDAALAAIGRFVADRVLVHVHVEGFVDMVSARDFRACLMRAMLRNCELVAITELTANAATRTGLFRHVWKVPNGVPEPARTGEPAAKDGPLRIAYVANMTPAKGIHLLLGSLQKISAAGGEFCADIIGETSALLSVSDVRQKSAELGLASKVSIHGPLYGDEKYRVFASAHLFVYPSRRDHAPLVLLEAMALGLVPIVVDTGGMAEILGPELAINVIPANLLDEPVERLLTGRISYYQTHRDCLRSHASAARQRYLMAYTDRHFGANMMKAFFGEESSRLSCIESMRRDLE